MKAEFIEDREQIQTSGRLKRKEACLVFVWGPGGGGGLLRVTA